MKRFNMAVLSVVLAMPLAASGRGGWHGGGWRGGGFGFGEAIAFGAVGGLVIGSALYDSYYCGYPGGWGYSYAPFYRYDYPAYSYSYAPAYNSAASIPAQTAAPVNAEPAPNASYSAPHSTANMSEANALFGR